MRRKNRALTLVEVILAMWVLFIAICFIFEVLRTSYTYVTKMKHMSVMTTLTSSKLEQIMYDNAVTDTLNTWLDFPNADGFYQFRVTTLDFTNVPCFPNYRFTKVSLESRGPRTGTSPYTYPFNIYITTVIMQYSQGPVTATEDRSGGGELSPDAHMR